MTRLLAAVDLQNNFFAGHPNAQAPFTSPGSLVTRVLPNIMIIAGVASFFYMIWGGWDMIMGAGKSGNPPELQKAWNRITYGIIGFLIVVGSFFILQIVQTLTGINIINPPAL